MTETNKFGLTAEQDRVISVGLAVSIVEDYCEKQIAGQEITEVAFDFVTRFMDKVGVSFDDLRPACLKCCAISRCRPELAAQREAVVL